MTTRLSTVSTARAQHRLREDALEIEAADGTKTIIAFETLPELPETTS